MVDSPPKMRSQSPSGQVADYSLNVLVVKEGDTVSHYRYGLHTPDRGRGAGYQTGYLGATLDDALQQVVGSILSDAPASIAIYSREQGNVVHDGVQVPPSTLDRMVRAMRQARPSCKVNGHVYDPLRDDADQPDAPEPLPDGAGSTDSIGSPSSDPSIDAVVSGQRSPAGQPGANGRQSADTVELASGPLGRWQRLLGQ